MFHPHVPEELKHFGKHLFATFLGLLLALGLEQWHEHHRDLQVLHAAVARVEAELGENLAKVDRERERAAVSMRTMDGMDAFLATQMGARRAGRPTEERLPEGNMGLGLRFTSDAWEALKLSGAFRHLPPDRAARLSRAYSHMQMVSSYAYAYPGLDRSLRDLVVLKAPRRAFRDWDPGRFQEVRESLWLLHDYFEWAHDELAWVRKGIQEAQKP